VLVSVVFDLKRPEPKGTFTEEEEKQMFYRPLYGEVGQARAAADAARARYAAELTREDVANLRCDIERLLMICEALWTMIREQHGYSDEELYRRVTQIDMRDGRLDGRVAPTPPPKCPNCGRTMAKHRPVCIFCGTPVRTDLFQR